MEAELKRLYSAQKVCEMLGITPHMLRIILSEYRSWLTGPEVEIGPLHVPAEDVATIRKIVKMQNGGKRKGEIVASLKQAQAGTGHGSSADAAGGQALQGGKGLEPEELLRRLDELNKALAQSESRRLEDRDRLLTALIRTQQEIQQLRYELALASSRKDRRRKGFLARLFG